MIRKLQPKKGVMNLSSDFWINLIHHVLLLLTMVMWSSNVVFMAWIAQDTDTFFANAERFFLSALFFFFFVIINRKVRRKVAAKDLLHIAFLAFIGVFTYNTLMSYGLKSSHPLTATLISSTTPVFTAFFAFLLYKNTLNRYQLLSLFIVFIGILMVLSGGDWNTILSLNFVKGDILILIAAIAWSLYTVFVVRWVQGYHPMLVIAYLVFFSSVFFVVLSLIMTEDWVHSFRSLTLAKHAVLLFMGVFASGLGYVFWNMGVKHFGSLKTAMHLNIVPVVTLFLAIPFGQYPSWFQIFGGVVVFFAIFLSMKKTVSKVKS